MKTMFYKHRGTIKLHFVDNGPFNFQFLNNYSPLEMQSPQQTSFNFMFPN